MAKERPIFNFFADLGEKIEDEEKTGHKAADLIISPFSFILLSSFLVFIAAGLLRSVIDEQAEAKVYSALTEQLTHAVPISQHLSVEKGRIQSVDLRERVAVVRKPNDNRFNVAIEPDTEIFIYLPTTRRLFRVGQGNIQDLLRGDRVAVVQDPSGRAKALIFAPRPPEQR